MKSSASLGRSSLPANPLHHQLRGHQAAQPAPELAALMLYLGSRTDIFAEQDRRHLMTVADTRSPLPIGAVRELLIRELNAAPETIFRWIEPEPRHSRLLTQSHLAWLLDGRPVVLKISRAQTRELVGVDPSSLAELLPRPRPTDQASSVSKARLQNAFDNARQSLDSETDLAAEAMDSAAIRADAEELPLLAAPTIHQRLCTSRLLVTDAIDGSTLDELLSAQGRAGITVHGRQTLALQVARVWLHQMLLGHRFPRWPRPENITLSTQGCLAFTGGGFGRLEPEDREVLWQYVQAMAAHDPERAYVALEPWLSVEDSEALHPHFRRLTPNRSNFGLDTAHLFPIQLLLQEQLLVEKASPLHPTLRDFYRSLFWLHTTVQQLAPERDVVLEAFEAIAVRKDLQDLQRRLQVPRLAQDLQRTAAMWMELPQELDLFLNQSIGPCSHRHRLTPASGAVIARDLHLLLALVISALLFQNLAAISQLAGLSERLGAIVVLTLGTAILMSPVKGR